jgi:predicted nucleic acid-binding protein
MEKYLIDTNIISDYFNACLPVNGLGFVGDVFDFVPNISVISQIELLCWKADKNIEDKVKDFISDSIVLPISNNVISYCIDIRRNYKIKLPDAIIAATAISNGCILLTNNEKDFLNIKSLKIINPHKI